MQTHSGSTASSTDQALRILVLTEMYPRKTQPTLGIFVHRECLALQRAGLDVRVLSPLPYSPRPLWYNRSWRNLGLVPRRDTWDGIGVRYPRYPRPPGAFYGKFEPFAMLPSLCACFRQWSREKPFDLIHAHGLTPCGMAAILLSKAFHLPCVCHARGSDVYVYPWRSRANLLLTRYVIEHCDAPVATSNALADRMSSIRRIPRKIRVLYKSVDTERFVAVNNKVPIRRRLGIQPQSFVAISVGSVSPDKGIGDLAEAWKHVAAQLPQPLLIVIGEGPEAGKIAALHPTVRVCGPRPNAEVALWMQASDVLILPSHSEGLPNVVLEAMACELPVIATPVGGIPEAVVHNETGLLVPVGDAQAIASAILRLADNKDLRRSMGKSGRNRIQTLFRWETYVSSASEIYRSVLDARSSEPPAGQEGQRET